MSAGAAWLILQMQNRPRGPEPQLPWWAVLLLVLGSLAFGGFVAFMMYWLMTG